jgi:RNA polymerase sigma-70 factor (ECF subfamily)
MIEDVVQSVFIKLWEERETILVTHIKTYLFVSARNRVLNSIRNEQKRRDLLQDYFVNELTKEHAEEIINIEDFFQHVEASVEQLPAKTKKVYLLSRQERMSYKEIATLEDISIKTVESHMSKALKLISANLKQQYQKVFNVFFLIFLFKFK